MQEQTSPKLTIVSTDGHAGPLVATYRDYLDPAFHAQLDQLIEEESEFLEISSRIGVFSASQLAIIDTDGAIASGGLTGARDDAGNMMEMAQDPRMKDLLTLNYSPRQVLWQLMVGGVFDRYPTLTYIPTEARADWIPATLAHMDRRYAAGDTPLTRPPSQYWADHCFAGASFIHRAELESRHEIGVRTLTFGRDYPHPEGTWPNTKDWLRAAFAGVPDDEARLILGENAIRCYGLDAAAVRAIGERVGPAVDELLGEHHVDLLVLHEFDKRGGFTKAAPELNAGTLDEILERTLVATARD